MNVLSVGLFAGEGNDTVIAGNNGTHIIIGDFSIGDSVQGGTGFDILQAHASNDVVLTISGQQGIMNGVVVFDDIEAFSFFGSDGNDQVDASAATLSNYLDLYGFGGDDTLIGSAYSDELTGDPGNDTLNGGGGDDRFLGGPNDDTFVFNVGSGNDVINDFNQGNLVVGSTEHDVIDVHAYGFSDWNALQAAISDDVVSGDAVIQLSATDFITVAGVHTADLHQNDFII